MTDKAVILYAACQTTVVEVFALVNVFVHVHVYASVSRISVIGGCSNQINSDFFVTR